MGGAIIGISGKMLIYEILMIVLSFKKVNHSVRLLVVCARTFVMIIVVILFDF